MEKVLMSLVVRKTSFSNNESLVKRTPLCSLQANFKTERQVTYLLLRLPSTQNSTSSPLGYLSRHPMINTTLIWFDLLKSLDSIICGRMQGLALRYRINTWAKNSHKCKHIKREKGWEIIKVLTWKWSQ